MNVANAANLAGNLLKSSDEINRQAEATLAIHDLLTDYSQLATINPSYCPANMYVLPNMNNLFEWFGTLFVHGGMYDGAVIQFIVRIPKSYPVVGPPAGAKGAKWGGGGRGGVAEAPSVEFTSPKKIPHPLIDPKDNELCLQECDYSPTVLLLLAFVKEVFYNSDFHRGLPEGSTVNKPFWEKMIAEPKKALDDIQNCIHEANGTKESTDPSEKGVLLTKKLVALGRADDDNGFDFKEHDAQHPCVQMIDRLLEERDLNTSERKHCFVEWYCGNYCVNIAAKKE